MMYNITTEYEENMLTWGDGDCLLFPLVKIQKLKEYS